MEARPSDKVEYELLISSDSDSDIRAKDFPNLDIYVLSSRNHLCPSYYSDARCVEGDLEAELEVNGITIIINDHDRRRGIVNQIVLDDGIYLFQGVAPLVIDRDKDQTYLIFTIEKLPHGTARPAVDIPSYDLEEIFTVKLGENITTGYCWEFETSPGLEILESQYTTHCTPGLAGCGGKRTLVLRGRERGTQTLTAYNIPPGTGRGRDGISADIMSFEIL